MWLIWCKKLSIQSLSVGNMKYALICSKENTHPCHSKLLGLYHTSTPNSKMTVKSLLGRTVREERWLPQDPIFYSVTFDWQANDMGISSKSMLQLLASAFLSISKFIQVCCCVVGSGKWKLHRAITWKAAFAHLKVNSECPGLEMQTLTI